MHASDRGRRTQPRRAARHRRAGRRAGPPPLPGVRPAVRQAFEAHRPSRVLIEGPRGFTDLLPQLLHPEAQATPRDLRLRQGAAPRRRSPTSTPRRLLPVLRLLARAGRRAPGSRRRRPGRALRPRPRRSRSSPPLGLPGSRTRSRARRRCWSTSATSAQQPRPAVGWPGGWAATTTRTCGSCSSRPPTCPCPSTSRGWSRTACSPVATPPRPDLAADGTAAREAEMAHHVAVAVAARRPGDGPVLLVLGGFHAVALPGPARGGHDRAPDRVGPGSRRDRRRPRPLRPPSPRPAQRLRLGHDLARLAPAGLGAHRDRTARAGGPPRGDSRAAARRGRRAAARAPTHDLHAGADRRLRAGAPARRAARTPRTAAQRPARRRHELLHPGRRRHRGRARAPGDARAAQRGRGRRAPARCGDPAAGAGHDGPAAGPAVRARGHRDADGQPRHLAQPRPPRTSAGSSTA